MAVGSGLGSTLTVTAVGNVQVALVGGVHTGMMEAPLMLCPQPPLDTGCPVGVVGMPTQFAATVGSEALPVLNGLETSPGRMEM